MNVYIIYSAEDTPSCIPGRTLCGRCSYIARGNSLMSEKLPRDARGDAMIISSDDIGEHITPAIYDECRRRGYRSVFLDSENQDTKHLQTLKEISSSLSRRSITVFCPLSHISDNAAAVPVAEAAVSGGKLYEYISYLISRNKRLALSLPLCRTEFDMPADKGGGHQLSARELLRTIDINSASIHYSPQMMTNYFLYSNSPGQCRFVLFDDARTISEKLRLAKKLGATDVFLVWKEISDIAADIIF